jgi:dephospho-CoA kinase
MKIIGLTGSIATGKSEVAKILRSADIPVFDSDAEVHELYASKQGVELVRPLIPEATVNNRVDRKTITKYVLKDPNLLPLLEQQVHTEIRKRREAFLAKAKMQARPLVALDIPLLFEVGADKDVDVVLVVSSAPEIQSARALQRPAMTAEKLEMILDRQLPDLEKRKRADFVIENNGSLDELQKAVLAVIAELKKAKENGP